MCDSPQPPCSLFPPAEGYTLWVAGGPKPLLPWLPRDPAWPEPTGNTWEARMLTLLLIKVGINLRAGLEGLLDFSLP